MIFFSFLLCQTENVNFECIENVSTRGDVIKSYKSSTNAIEKKNMFLKCGWIFDFSSWLFSLKYIGQFDEPLYVCLWKFGFFFIKETLSTLSSFNRLVNIWNKYSLALSNKAAINRGNATLFEIVLLPLHRTPIIHTMKVKAENWLNVCLLSCGLLRY